jgi:hypothetical protein
MRTLARSFYRRFRANATPWRAEVTVPQRILDSAVATEGAITNRIRHDARHTGRLRLADGGAVFATRQSLQQLPTNGSQPYGGIGLFEYHLANVADGSEP